MKPKVKLPLRICLMDISGMFPMSVCWEPLETNISPDSGLGTLENGHKTTKQEKKRAQRERGKIKDQNLIFKMILQK